MSKAIILLPAYNEAAQIGEQIKHLISYLRQINYGFEILVVDDGSTDDTAKIVKELVKNSEISSAPEPKAASLGSQTNISSSQAVKLISHKSNQGLGEAMKTGINFFVDNYSDGDILIAMDADSTHDINLIKQMILLINQGNDLVIASRYQKGSKVIGLSKFREFLSFGASIFFRIFHPIKGVKDYSCGYRAYSMQVLKKLIYKFGQNFISRKDFSCMAELLLNIGTVTYKITEIPMILRYDRKMSSSKIKILKTIVSTVFLAFAKFTKKR